MIMHRGARRRIAVVAAAVSMALGTGCEVTNPGPVNDEFITLPASRAGFVNGAQEKLVETVTELASGTALVSRELFPGGTPEGQSLSVLAGSLEWNDAGLSDDYPLAQQSRWIAEEAIRRLSELEDVEPGLLFKAYIWAGYANRILGENWCEAVIDGGPLQPGSVYFERAEQHFTDALALAATPEDRYKALAGRAQIRMWQEDWTGAVADAQQVPTDFGFFLEVDFSGNTAQRNRVWYHTASEPYRTLTVRFTYFDTYYPETGDPRTPWIDYPNVSDRVCVGSLQGFGGVPCTFQQKYPEENSDFRLAGGREMRLIEAEALLVAGDWQAAMAKINQVRTGIISNTTGQPLEPWAASSLEEAWTALKRERGIELWLEARRMGDQRRWEPILGQPTTPGDLELPDFEAQSDFFVQYPRGREMTEGVLHPRVLCYNISDDERNTNPNIPDVG